MCRQNLRGFRDFLALFAVASMAVTASVAAADEIQVDGDVLRGKVENVTASSIEFSTEYGGGTLSIPLDKIESISSEKQFYFIHGDDGATTGKVLAVRDGKFLVGSDETNATEIDPASIHDVYDAEKMEGRMGWLRRATALWHGTFDLGFGVTKSTTDTTSVAAGFTFDRKKKPSRVTASASYRYGTQKTKDDDPATDDGKETTENEIKGMIRGEYDLMPRLYWYASQDAEYDEIESLSYRLVPKSGLGYRLWESDSGLFQLEAGGAYVYENYFGSDDDGYFAIAFGKLLEWKLPWFGSEFSWRTDYLPAADDWGNYLIRSDAALLVPMISWLKFKIGVSETYNSEPAEDADKNTLTTTAGLAAVY
jgi:putative salt-induced outer membrane protein YdiY